MDGGGVSLLGEFPRFGGVDGLIETLNFVPETVEGFGEFEVVHEVEVFGIGER